MPLLTELEKFWGWISINMSPLTGLVLCNHCRCEFFWTNFLDGHKVKIVKRKNSEQQLQVLANELARANTHFYFGKKLLANYQQFGAATKWTR
jgi:hypothetical protein